MRLGGARRASGGPCLTHRWHVVHISHPHFSDQDFSSLAKVAFPRFGAPFGPLGPRGAHWAPLGPIGAPWGPLGLHWGPLGPIGAPNWRAPGGHWRAKRLIFTSEKFVWAESSNGKFQFLNIFGRFSIFRTEFNIFLYLLMIFDRFSINSPHNLPVATFAKIC